MTHDLRIDSYPAVLIEDGSILDPTVSPRPYLHPIFSPRGVLLTELAPADHPHHTGLSLALSDVNGTHHWGGKTYIHPHGYQWQHNHGRQIIRTVTSSATSAAAASEADSPAHSDPDQAPLTWQAQIDWLAHDGDQQATEQRTLSLTPLTPTPTSTAQEQPGDSQAAPGYRLTWRSTLTAHQPLTIGSPATHGRADAGYGGIFWRFPANGGFDVVGPHDQGEADLNGATHPWIAVRSAAQRVSVILSQHNDAGQHYPWFVRMDEYPGVGPAVAWEDTRHLACGQSLTLGLTALVLDTYLATAAHVCAAHAQFAQETE